jgi:hypothetical protein
MPICSDYECSKSDESSKRLNFYRFPNREKSPDSKNGYIFVNQKTLSHPKILGCVPNILNLKTLINLMFLEKN